MSQFTTLVTFGSNQETWTTAFSFNSRCHMIFLYSLLHSFWNDSRWIFIFLAAAAAPLDVDHHWVHRHWQLCAWQGVDRELALVALVARTKNSLRQMIIWGGNRVSRMMMLMVMMMKMTVVDRIMISIGSSTLCTGDIYGINVGWVVERIWWRSGQKDLNPWLAEKLRSVLSTKLKKLHVTNLLSARASCAS